MNGGWIKIHRQLKEHWIWTSERRLKWWLDILFTVNHCDSQVLVKGTLIECKRGQSIRSLGTWAKEWQVSKGAVRDFFKLLESDQMLIIEPLSSTTRITVCNYDDYQTDPNAKETIRKRKTNAKETLALPKQECKEDNKSFTTISDFYREQVKVAEKYLYDNPDNPKVKADVNAYKEFVLFLHDWKHRDKKDSLGNSLHTPLVNVLGIPKQLKFLDFIKHYNKARELNIDFYEKIKAMENRPDTLIKRVDFNLTLYNWIKPYKKND